jgi:hypothetical protein
MVGRGPNSKAIPIDIVGSSTFGRYFKISASKTVNMLITDEWLADYAGYQSVNFNQVLGTIGRGIYTSTKLGQMVAVISNNVWLLDVFYNQTTSMPFDAVATFIGTIATTTGVVYITETDKPEIVISDGINIYVYNPAAPPMYIARRNTAGDPITFTPGYIDFHDLYIIAAASHDTGGDAVPAYNPPANNTWRISTYDDNVPPKLIFPAVLDGVSYVGLLQTKPDNTQVVARMPSKGNMILVMGETVTEPWFDNGIQQFPYVRNNQFNIDYGCLNPATFARTDEIAVWLAQNEKSGPIIMFTKGGMPEKITTDGIDYLFSQLQNPADSQGFIYRQDGHLIYHINFYTDNLSLFYDFNTKKFFHATDEFGNYFIAAEVAFFNNQYYFISKNNGNVYAFDTIYTTYDGAQIPRERICGHIREKNQKYFIANDVGFTIEQGENNPTPNGIAYVYVTNGGSGYTNATVTFLDGNGYGAAATATIVGGAITAITLTNPGTGYTYGPFVLITGDGTGATALTTLNQTSARVDLSVSYDGGQIFGNDYPYVLNPNGVRMNMLNWWNLGITNDIMCRFRFYALGRFVAYDGELNIR